MKTKIRMLALSLSLFCLLLAMPARATNYTLTVTIQGAGTIATNPTMASYRANVTVGLTATPSVGWYFAGWSGDVSGTTNEVNVYMSDNMSVTALFLPYPIYTLTLTTNGQGAIGLNPAGGSYYSNTLVSATETPAAGWVFTGWSEATNGLAGTVSLALDTDLALTANFAQLPAFDLQPQGMTNVVGSTVTFSSHSVGSSPLAYQWYFGGNPLSGATSATLTLADATANEAGFYQVIATNEYDSATSSVAVLVLTNASGPTNIVSVCDETDLRAAIAAGGWVKLGCSSTITLSGTINVTKNVILDGTGVSATISGRNAVPIFYVEPGVSFSATNLTLANGSSIVTSGSGSAAGGAIYNNGGTVTLTTCTLTNNSAFAEIIGGTAQGGAIYSTGGKVSIYASQIIQNAVCGAYETAPGYPNNGGFGLGGAIFNASGSLVIVDSLVQSNSCGNVGGGSVAGCLGGAVYEAGGALFITNCTFVGNLALGGNAPDQYQASTAAYGGGLAAVGGSLSMDLCQWAGNTAKGGDAALYQAPTSPGGGGAVYCSNTWTAVRCSFFGNQALGGNQSYSLNSYPSPAAAGIGGAIYNLGPAIVNQCVVFSNYTLGGTPVAVRSTVNSGGNALGGGIYNAAELKATNCTLALNTAQASEGVFGNGYRGSIYSGNALGGGLYNAAGGVFLAVNVTLASNGCSSPAATQYNNQYDTYVNGLAAGAQVANATGSVSLLNSLLAYGSTNGNANGTIIDLGDNMSSDGSANFASGSSYDFTDPLLSPLANNGGPTLTMALLPDSPAIAFADSEDGAPPDDQRGYARPTGTGVIDLGAYQYGATQIYYPPTVLSLSIAEAFPNVLVSFTTSPQITNTIYLQSSTNLINWIDLQTIGASATPSNISETISLEGAPQKFFRLMW